MRIFDLSDPRAFDKNAIKETIAVFKSNFEVNAEMFLMVLNNFLNDADFVRNAKN
jgi:hypothetical protein